MVIDKAKIDETLKRMQPRGHVIKSAERYHPVDDLCILTTYFNPCDYSGLRNNYMSFKQSIEKSGLTLITVECAFSGAPFQLQAEENVIQVRANSIIWQKECLLNIGLQSAKRNFTKVAWLDADIFFVDAQWAVRVSAMLDQFQIVQPFSEVGLLSRGMTYYEGSERITEGMASALSHDRALLKERFEIHGHSGYGWAARTEALPDGLFDGCLTGAGDHVMAHAFYGDIDGVCIGTTFYNDSHSRQYFQGWAAPFFARVQDSVGYCQGTVLHRWHGSPKNRDYAGVNRKLARFGINPEIDLRKNSDGCWEWNTNRPALQRHVADYFTSRREDEE